MKTKYIKWSSEGKCLYCGRESHESKLLVCDTFIENPLPYKIVSNLIPKPIKNTEVLKLITI
jgi:hypothetical protein